jgi:hypothetical protein
MAECGNFMEVQLVGCLISTFSNRSAMESDPFFYLPSLLSV